MFKKLSYEYIIYTVILIFAVTISVYTLSESTNETYIFPKIIVIAMTLLISLLIVSKLRQGSNRVSGSDEDSKHEDSKHSNHRLHKEFASVIPVVVILGALILFAEGIGFYASGLLVFVSIAIIFSPRRRDIQYVLSVIAIATIFMSVIYVVFGVILQVQTPRGFLL